MRIRIVFVLAGVLCLPFLARAEHARIDLQISQFDPVKGEVKLANASVDQDPPAGGRQARPVAKVKAKEPLVLQFMFDNLYPHKVIKDARVHYFVVPVDKVGQKTLPDLTQNVMTEGKFTLNFKPNGRVGARVAAHLRPGGLRVLGCGLDAEHVPFTLPDGVAKATDRAPLAQCLIQRLAEGDADLAGVLDLGRQAVAVAGGAGGCETAELLGVGEADAADRQGQAERRRQVTGALDGVEADAPERSRRRQHRAPRDQTRQPAEEPAEGGAKEGHE